MKKINSILTIIVLSASIALADDGHTGSGGRCSNCPPPCTVNCGGGSLVGTEPGHISESENDAQSDESSFIEQLKEFFLDLVG